MFFHNVDLYLYSVLHFKEKKKRIQTSRKHMIELGDYSWFFWGGVGKGFQTELIMGKGTVSRMRMGKVRGGIRT